MIILSKVLIPKRKNYSIFLKIHFSPKKSRRTLVAPVSFHAAAIHSNPSTMESAPYSPRCPLTSLKSSSPLSPSPSSLASVMFLSSIEVCWHRQRWLLWPPHKIICGCGVWRQVSKKQGQKGKQLCSFYSHANDANYSLRSQLASFTIGSVCLLFSRSYCNWRRS